ncbi:MAG: phosphotransferase [Ktedonobacterales bacterium]|nr:phosphotransferase [Ktedonobacterales bacterium]
MKLAALRRAWPRVVQWRMRPLAGGTNTRVRLVETPVGRYVLRIYSHHVDLERLRFEHSILTRLRAEKLPFAVPAPIPTETGDLYARMPAADMDEGGDGEALATLTAFIPGAHPRQGDLAHAMAAGEALATLDAALARISERGAADAGTTWRSYGDLEHCHPLVPDPLAAMGELPMADVSRRRLAARYVALMADIPGVYGRLPRQLTHEDCGPSNVLMEGPRVTGILDFEFCARDVRVMDLAVALSWWPGASFGSGEEWPILRAVAEGYGRQVTLTAEEIEALPLLFQLRAYTSLLHRLGRFRQGLSPLEAVTDRAAAALEREAWLAAHSERLIATVREAEAGEQRRAT